MDVVRTVFPGKELLKETLKILNARARKAISRSQLVAVLDEPFVADDMKKMLAEVAGS